MNPQNGTPLDYLNEIAPQAPKKPGFSLNLKTVLLGAAVVIVIIIIIASVGGALSNSRKDPWQRFFAKLDATATAVDSSTGEIKNSQLRSMNSDLKLYITNTKRDFTPTLEALGIAPGKLPASIVAEETGTGMDERLESGRLNARYDSTYAREMTYQLATILALLQKLYSSNVGPKTKESLESAYNNLLPTYTSLSEFTTTTE